MTPSYTEITTQALRSCYEQDPQLLIVDLRDQEKYQQGHIQGAVSFPFPPTLWSRLFKSRSLARLLGRDHSRAIAFY
ncbi:rhodanese-like domain-containing protein [Desulfogranum mediterraneum]|uniref:rhodanese-like domain-containing protein n=1 Tax=Desulfogranum mediterraneum TaxID=160661 RepID=UPI000429DDD9|nr:rhodanese-like domain-containing protein [Desulfogranum mediterraneum]